LAEQVQLADIVLCPSSWSAPVEGAVLKSLAHNGLVGLYVHETSFASEIPADARVCIDPKDMERTVATLRRLLKNPAEMEAMRAAARQFITRYAVDNRSMLGSLRSACGLA
jgi:glycosyltransferase involved in cell wall biosynthesis